VSGWQGFERWVTLWSRRGNLFTKQFPHIARACERLPPGTLVDGDVVALDANGRVSFNLLQHHLSKAQALLFYVFDVLAYRGRSLLNCCSRQGFGFFGANPLSVSCPERGPSTTVMS
jgi:ATP-dependent DNA ligase